MGKVAIYNAAFIALIPGIALGLQEYIFLLH
jgi:hypothetical protein